MTFSGRLSPAADHPGQHLAALFIGFDSAWMNSPKAKGAISSILFDGMWFREFSAPEPVDFDGALSHIAARRQTHVPTIIGIDQPTIVANGSGMRPVERLAASLISWMGGGVQPANRGRAAMFGDGAPIWRFLGELRAIQDPELARSAIDGLHVMEVFPALALASFDNRFFGRLKGPRYNPARRKTFRKEDWSAVIEAARAEAGRRKFGDLEEWLEDLSKLEGPKKAHQDCLDAALCLLVALRWRLAPRADSVMIGDLQTGYIVSPASEDVFSRLSDKAASRSVRVDSK